MSRRKTTKEFMNQANKVHDNKYNYSKTKYVNSHTKVIITCQIHGDFEQIPNNHLQGKGCRKCADDALSEERKFDQTKVLEKANLVHNNKYKYDLKDYVNYHSKVVIICPEHGEFNQSLTAHINGCQGCPICGQENRQLNNMLTTEDFIKKSKSIHKNTYLYDKVNYTGWGSKVIITCKIHGDFLQSPRDHFDGCGCQNCAKHGFDPNKPAYLYYLKITTDNNQILYKIGITNRTVNERFNLTDLAKIEILKQKLYENGQDAWDFELLIKRNFKEYKYQGPDILSSGNTELFIEDVYSKFIEQSQ